MSDEKLLIFLNENVQQFIKEQVALTERPIVVAGCMAAQLRHLYVALIGEEDACKVFKEMSVYKPEKPTMH
jgi:predicted metal-binding protein